MSELLSDMDELLTTPRYSKYIEKIKTTMATYMGASGLHIEENDDPDEHHLETMIEFCLDIQKIVEAFNKEMLWFS